MARKNVLYGYDMLSGNITNPPQNAVSATLNSNPIVDVSGQDYGTIDLQWSASSLVATVNVQARNGQNDAWRTLNFGSAISISGGSGSHEIILTQMGFTDLRLNIVVTSGTGTVNAFLTTKAQGS